MLVSSVFASDVERRRSKILGIINEEISEVNRLYKQTGSRDADLMLRMAELYLEKARLVRESENEAFLKVSPERRRRTKKSVFFRKSEKNLALADSMCKRIIKRNPRYKYMGNVYYILGYNAKEKSHFKTATRYLQSAVKKGVRSSETRYKAQIALGETYYNRKMYTKAIPLYESALRRHKDKWWTKDSYNLAWCYYKKRQYSKGIDKLLEINEKSESDEYIDMRDSVKRDIGLFYAESGRTSEGIRFYRDQGEDYSDELLKISESLRRQGKYTKAQSTLNEALKIQKDDSKKTDIYLNLLDLSDQFGKHNSHLKYAKILETRNKKGDLNSDQLKKLKYQVGKQGATLQKQVASKIYQKAPNIIRKKSALSVEYFDLMKKLEPSKEGKYVFLQGETSFASKKYTSALSYYNKAHDIARKSSDSKTVKLSLEGMLAALGKRGVSRKTKDKYYEVVYPKYIQYDSKSKKSASIQKKLFNAYFQKKKVASAEQTLDSYKKNFPSDYKSQEGMLAQLMEHYRKKGQNTKVKSYMTAINNGEYKVSGKYKNKLSQLLTSMQIDNVQKDLEQGRKKKALEGYHNILEDKNSTTKARTNAKYNLAALYYELGATEDMYKWATESLSEMKSKDSSRFASSFLAMTSYLFGVTEIEKSGKLSLLIFSKICTQRNKKKIIAFRNAAYMSLASKNFENVLKILSMAPKCKIASKEVNQVHKEMLLDYADEKRWDDYARLLKKVSAKKKNYSYSILAFEKLEKIHRSHGNTNLASQYYKSKIRMYKLAKKYKQSVSREAADSVATLELSRMNGVLKSLKVIPALSFPEKVYNKVLERKLGVIKQLTGYADKVQKVGSGTGITKSYDMLIEAYESVGKEIQSFTPQGKEPSYVKSFKQAMSGVYNPLFQTARQYRAEIKKAIMKNDILDKSNFRYLSADGAYINYEGPSPIIMDRGGVR